MSAESTTHRLGQYMTTNQLLKDTLCDFIQGLKDVAPITPMRILEPSIGCGDLVLAVIERFNHVKFSDITMCEIDEDLEQYDEIPMDQIIYGDFLAQQDLQLFDTIIANPPFVRTKSGNLYVDFLKRCFDLLDNEGELIFIVPYDVFKLTCAAALLSTMLRQGVITHVFHPNNEKLFNGASIDVVVFRYCKTEHTTAAPMEFNGKPKYVINNGGVVTFSNNLPTNHELLSDYMTAFVGIVSGSDKVFKNAFIGNIDVLSSDGHTDRFILVNDLTSDPAATTYLTEHKATLLRRKIRKFNELNWFEWGALRNISTVRANIGKDCIYVHNLTRKSTVAFRGVVQHFGGNLIMLLPHEVGVVDLDALVHHINHAEFRDMFDHAGRFKIGQRHLLNCHMPSVG
jgi:adenine-specific DNA-methyltransferase